MGAESRYQLARNATLAAKAANSQLLLAPTAPRYGSVSKPP
jgi:hypothetical protein